MAVFSLLSGFASSGMFATFAAKEDISLVASYKFGEIVLSGFLMQSIPPDGNHSISSSYSSESCCQFP